MASRGAVIGASAIVVLFLVGAWNSWRYFAEGRDNGHLPSDFPYAFISAEDNGEPKAVVISVGRNPPLSAIIDGRERWPAWQCLNEVCPGRQDGHAFLFAYGQVEEDSTTRGPTTWCPACAPAFNAGKTPIEKAPFDPSNIIQYHTAEGERMLAAVRARLAP